MGSSTLVRATHKNRCDLRLGSIRRVWFQNPTISSGDAEPRHHLGSRIPQLRNLLDYLDLELSCASLALITQIAKVIAARRLQNWGRFTRPRRLSENGDGHIVAKPVTPT